MTTSTFGGAAPISTTSGLYDIHDSIFSGARRTSSMKVLIAIDFGTTHSAVSWTIYNERSKSEPEIHVIQQWPTKSNTFDKVPTLLHYDGVSTTPAWGFPVCDEDRRYEWFKLEQDPKYTQSTLRRKYPHSAIPPESPSEVETLITDYLKLIRAHSEAEIRRHYELKPRGFLNIPWEYIITVPAMWPEPAQNVTMRSAQNAGMGQGAQIKIIAEPEAAGIYGLRTFASDATSKGDTFMICDAGGGTVDLISYTITQGGSNPRMAEASPGTGGLCGSSFLDRRFNSWLDNHFKYCPDWNSQYQMDALEKWEKEVKRDFRGDDKATYVFKVPNMKDNPGLGVQKNRLYVPGSIVKNLFRPVIDEILTLVQAQLETVRQNDHARNVKAIFLAGGFGNNDYLKERIAKAVGRGIKVGKMQDWETAIVRGALMRGLAEQSPNSSQSWPTVETKRAKTHYGISVLAPFNPKKHDHTRELIAGGSEGGKRVQIMQWFIEKNKIYRDGEPQNFDFYLDERDDDVRRNGGRLSDVVLDIYTCAHDQAPVHPDAPGYPSKCNKIARLPTRLNLIPIDELEKKFEGSQRFWYVVHFKINMIRHLESVRFDLVFTPNKGEPRKITHVNTEWISA